MQNIIQIAGVLDAVDCHTLIDAGVDFVGIPLRLKDGREDLSEAAARDLVASLPEHIRVVVITYLDSADKIIGLCDEVGVNWVQLHGAISADEIRRIRARRPGLSIIKSVIVSGHDGEQLITEARAFESLVDAFITDTYDPHSGRSGATGKTHDWNISRALVEALRKPVILAGGLTPDNVTAAITQVAPVGVDAHTGVEGENGRNDPVRVRQFVAAARQAFARLK